MTRSDNAVTQQNVGSQHGVPPRLERVGRVLGASALITIKVVTIALTVESVLQPDLPRYRGKAMRIRAIGYAAGLALVPGVWTARGRIGPYPVSADLAASTPLLIDAVGNRLGIYDRARIDDLVHFVNGAALSSLFGAAISARMPSAASAAAATVVCGVTGELLFDAMEYVAERAGYGGLGLSRADTTADVAAATLGAALGAAITWRRWARGVDPASTGRGRDDRRRRG